MVVGFVEEVCKVEGEHGEVIYCIESRIYLS